MLCRFILVLIVALPLALATNNPQTPTMAAAAGRGLGYGILAQDYSAAASMGFTTAKIFANWNILEPSRGTFSGSEFNALGGAVDSARSSGLQVLLNVGRSPSWATGSDSDTAPPLDDGDLARFIGYLASYFRGRVAAYEIWNEPNLRIEWGGQQPDPVKYAAMLRALYPSVKSADPNALVITGGLSTAGDGISYWNYGDLLWIKDLYQAGNVKSCSDGQGGLRSCFDALGSHPYGGPFSPETGPEVAQYTVGLYFRRAAQQKQMMDVWGSDYDRGVWATEFNWLLNPAAFGVSCSWGSNWDSYMLKGPASEQEATQADYLVRAYNYAYINWPWMQQMIVFNLDFPGRGTCDQVTWYSLTRPDGSRRPAYDALANMTKLTPTASLQVSDNNLVFLMEPGAANTASRTVRLTNSIAGALAWTATKSAAPWLSLNSASGTAPSDLAITVDTATLASGDYSATVTIESDRASSVQIDVKMHVGSVYRKQMPTIAKNS